VSAPSVSAAGKGGEIKAVGFGSEGSVQFLRRGVKDSAVDHCQYDLGRYRRLVKSFMRSPEATGQ
jgi:hypothetical protein